ncbi:MAG: right-handed parallel beta-helix repeat-containing protein [Methanotrichaceae archaeon]|nr:right-handed parallel beta-helix repeat-containing protein [Methanotrichaceae archaeon]
MMMMMRVPPPLCLMLLALALPSAMAFSIGCQSGGAAGALSMETVYDLDSPAAVQQSIFLGEEAISSSARLMGGGENSMTMGGEAGSLALSSQLIVHGDIDAATSSYISRDLAVLVQFILAEGMAEAEVYGSASSKEAYQRAGVLQGALSCEQLIALREGEAWSVGDVSTSGSMGFASAEAGYGDQSARITGGQNGEGDMSGIFIASAGGEASAWGALYSQSLDSKSYSAAEAASSRGTAYSYLSSGRQSSVMNASSLRMEACQDVEAIDDVLVYAIRGDARYSARAAGAKGRIAAEGPSPIIALQGDVEEDGAGQVPVPGSWIWNSYGGLLKSNPFLLRDANGEMHAFVRGDDDGLWDRREGDWYGLGGVITSDPFALLDGQGRIHVLVRGSDWALWDCLDGSWIDLGGMIMGGAGAALEPGGDQLTIAVRGMDGAVWLKDLEGVGLGGSWTPIGGVAESNARVTYDSQGTIHTFVRGSDGCLWDNRGVPTGDGYAFEWTGLGGTISSDAWPLNDPFHPNMIYTYVRGSDGALWCHELDVGLGGVGSWQGLGGLLSGADGLYRGNPVAGVASDGAKHVFVRASDGCLWDCVDGQWYGLGGPITTDPSLARDGDGRLRIAVGGSGLWVNTLGIEEQPTSLVGPWASDFSSIQGAVDSMVSGGLIRILSGEYRETVLIDHPLELNGVDNGSGLPVVDAGGEGSAMTLLADGCTVENLVLMNASGAGLSVSSNHNAIRGNVLTGNGIGLGIWLSEECLIENNWVNENVDGIVCDRSNDCIISGNAVDGNAGYGIYLNDSGRGGIIQNSASFNGCSGIEILGSAGVIAMGNNASENGGDGIFAFDSESITFAENTASRNELSGIEVAESNGCNITGNQLDHNLQDGIYVSNSAFSTLARNDAIGNDWTGIELWASAEADIRDSRLIQNGGSGLVLMGSSRSILVSNNASQNTVNGIEVTNSDEVVLRENEALLNGGDGIILSFSPLSIISANDVSQNGWTGLEIINSNGLDISGNVVDFNSAGGILVLNSREGAISSNQACHNEGNGIEIWNSKGSRLSWNNASENGESGIILDGSSQCTMTGDIADFNRKDGIFIFQSEGANLSEIHVQGNNWSGLELWGANGSIVEGSHATENNGSGILLYETDRSFVVDGNASLNGLSGIGLVASDGVVIEGCQIRGNAWGLTLEQSNESIIYRNAFVGNVINAYSEGANRWNSSQVLQYTYLGSNRANYMGNYWDDYGGVDLDGDGIGDSAYAFQFEEDAYPLMEPFDEYQIL